MLLHPPPPPEYFRGVGSTLSFIFSRFFISRNSSFSKSTRPSQRFFLPPPSRVDQPVQLFYRRQQLSPISIFVEKGQLFRPPLFFPAPSSSFREGKRSRCGRFSSLFRAPYDNIFFLPRVTPPPLPSQEIPHLSLPILLNLFFGCVLPFFCGRV